MSECAVEYTRIQLLTTGLMNVYGACKICTYGTWPYQSDNEYFSLIFVLFFVVLYSTFVTRNWE